MTNLLDEGIDYHKSMDWKYVLRVVRTSYSAGPQYQSTADTIVQLIRRSTSGVIAPSQPIQSE